jgi:hypothetical protein
VGTFPRDTTAKPAVARKHSARGRDPPTTARL